MTTLGAHTPLKFEWSRAHRIAPLMTLESRLGPGLGVPDRLADGSGEGPRRQPCELAQHAALASGEGGRERPGAGAPVERLVGSSLEQRGLKRGTRSSATHLGQAIVNDSDLRGQDPRIVAIGGIELRRRVDGRALDAVDAHDVFELRGQLEPVRRAARCLADPRFAEVEGCRASSRERRARWVAIRAGEWASRRRLYKSERHVVSPGPN